MVSFCKGLDVNHDRPIDIPDDRIDEHLHIVLRNRKDLSYVVPIPKPPPTQERPPTRFQYIEPEQDIEVRDIDPEPEPPDNVEEIDQYSRDDYVEPSPKATPKKIKTSNGEKILPKDPNNHK